jgi:hypothetical protein
MTERRSKITDIVTEAGPATQDVLSNSQINLISGVTCAAAAAWWSGRA